jgi:stage III sporulation protein SpoIIIAA
MTVTPYADDLQLLIATLPQPLQNALAKISGDTLLEVVLDLGRTPQARLPAQAINLAEEVVTHAELDQVIQAVGEFSADNRAGIEGTLHRISGIRNRQGDIIGLTLRVGRAVFGTIDLIRDLVQDNHSVLLLGRPGIGKTTKLREIARVMADEFNKRVIVIDTSNEIAGDGDIPHRAIGSARRMQVAHPDRQHAVMIEAVENHMPEVVIVDEIGTTAETMAARTIAERGVQLIATAHGNTLDNLVRNPTLSDLVGGIQTVTLGDDEARHRGTQKTINERKAPPTFDAVVEIVGHEELIVHNDTAEAVDRLLLGQSPGGIRRTPAGEVQISENAVEEPETPTRWSLRRPQGPVNIYPYAISRDSLQRVIRDLRLEARSVNNPDRAHMIIALRARTNDDRLQRLVQSTGLPVHTVRKNTTSQIRRLLQNTFNLVQGVDESDIAAIVRETEAGIRRALEEGVVVELAPRSASLRQMQHRVASRHRVVVESVGSEPLRHLVIYPHAFATIPAREIL